MGRDKWCLPVLVLALLLANLVGCTRTPGSPDKGAGVPAVTRIDGEWWQFFPARYGNSRNPGGSFLGEGCFELSPDGSWSVTLVKSANRSGYDLHLIELGAGTSDVLFSVSALEPDPTFSYLVCRAVWAGDSKGVFATVQPEEGSQYAETFFITLDGTAKTVSSPAWSGANTVLAPIPGTALFLVQDLSRPQEMSLMTADGSAPARYVAEGDGLLVFEDADSDCVLLSRIVDSTKSGPFYSGPLDSGNLLKLGEGWCPRFRPNGQTITYLRDATDGLELVELDLQSRESTVLAKLAGMAQAKDCLWEAANSVLVLGIEKGNPADVVIRVELSPAR